MGQEIEDRGNYLFNLIQTDVSTVNETLKPMPMWKEIFQADSPAKAEFSAHLGELRPALPEQSVEPLFFDKM